VVDVVIEHNVVALGACRIRKLVWHLNRIGCPKGHIIRRISRHRLTSRAVRYQITTVNTRAGRTEEEIGATPACVRLRRHVKPVELVVAVTHPILSKCCLCLVAKSASARTRTIQAVSSAGQALSV